MIHPLFSRLLRRRAAAEAVPGRSRRVPIRFPLKFTGRAVVCDGSGPEPAALRALAPEAIAAPLQRALELADAKLRGTVELPSLSFAIVVLTDISDAPLQQHQRDLLWRAFRVPVFEQMRGWDGNVIARECETHGGLHVVPGVNAKIERGELLIAGRKTGLTALLATEHCECGAETETIRNLTVFPSAKAAAA